MMIIAAPRSLATTAVFSDSELASGNPVTQDGITLTTTRSGGSIQLINNPANPDFVGLYLSGTTSGGTYTLSFSHPIISLEFEFDAFSWRGDLGAEELRNFSTDADSVNIAYTSQGFTTFEAGVITSTGTNGQGIIQFSASEPFTEFTFQHIQNPELNGFVIERVEAVSEQSSIGIITSGSGTVTRGGQTFPIGQSDQIFQDDVLETGAGQQLSGSFDDASTFQIGEEGKIRLDEYAYEPDSPDNVQNFSVLRGAISFVSGLMPKPKVRIDTPVVTLGIRGTEFSLEVTESQASINIDLSVTSGIVDLTDPSTGTTHAVATGETHSLTAPLPSLNTIRSSVQYNATPTLRLEGYTDSTFIVQHSDNMVFWEDWATLEPSDLPSNLDIMDLPARDMRFFRLKRTTPAAQ